MVKSRNKISKDCQCKELKYLKDLDKSKGKEEKEKTKHKREEENGIRKANLMKHNSSVENPA